VKILYFAWLREKVGAAEEERDLPEALRTVADLVDWLKLQSPRHEAAFENARLVRCAVDQEFGTPDTSIAGAREIAFFPPVTGG
jgi:molybdopterin synthase sulfur carrier subunit